MSADPITPPDPSGVQVILTKRLILRRLRADDAENLFPILSNPESMQWLGPMIRKTVQETQDWINERLARPGIDSFLVGLLPEMHSATTSSPLEEIVSGQQPLQEVIGITGSSGIPRIGYIFHPKYFGKGYAAEALVAYMKSYWDRVPPVSSGRAGSFDFAQAATDVENLPSRKLLEKCGFILDRIDEKGYENPVKGGLRDDAVYVIARPGMDVSEVRIPKPES